MPGEFIPKHDVCALLTLIFVVAACLTPTIFALGNKIATPREQQRAVEAGVGYWTVDLHTGERQFIYGIQLPPTVEGK